MRFLLSNPRSRHPTLHPYTAFSLVEVTLALGIMAFALVSLMGLLPIGLTTFRNVMNDSTGAEISQRLLSEAQQTDYTQLVATPQTIRYFDSQGNELPAANKAGALYETNLVLVTGATGTILPGATANPNLATVLLQIAANPGNLPLISGSNNQWTAVTGVTISSYAVNVANNVSLN